MVFKHYPGLFTPLDKGTPSVFQLLYWASDLGECWLVQCQHCGKKYDTLEIFFVWKHLVEKSLHQHDNKSSTFLLWVVPCPMAFCLHLLALTHWFTSSQSFSSYSLCMFSFFLFFLHNSWLGLTLTKCHNVEFQFRSKANWDALTVNFHKRTN